MEKITFKVAMDNEQKLAKNTHDVEIHVSRPDDIPDIIWEHAIANYKVRLQGQIRPNWDRFIRDEFPKTLAFGEALYTKTAKAAPITIESAAAFLNQGSELEVLTKKIDMIESMGMEVPQHMWDKMDELT